MVSILTTEDPAALRSRAIRRLVRFVTITIIVRERERARESSTSLFVFRKGLPFSILLLAQAPAEVAGPNVFIFRYEQCWN